MTTETPVKDKKSDEILKHRLAARGHIPIPGEDFQKELEALSNEIKEWKNKFEGSAAVQLAARLGKRPNFTPAATGESIKKFLTDDTGKEHLKILKKNPATYASRIAVVVSTMKKGSGLDDRSTRKIFIQAAAGNYNTETRVEKKVVDNISSVNLKVVLRAQSLYFDAFIRECKKVIEGLRIKNASTEEDIYKQQRIQITQLVEKIQANAFIIYEYKMYVAKKQPDEKKKNVAYDQDLVLNLNEFDGETIEEKRFRSLIQTVYHLIQIIRGCTLLYPLGHRIADKVIKYGRYKGDEHPIGYLLKGQLHGDEYLLAFKGLEKSYREDKAYYATKMVAAFQNVSHYYSIAQGKVNNQTEKSLKEAIAVDFAEYLLNFCEAHERFLRKILKMQPLSKEWLNPLLSKTKNGLMAIEGSARVEELYLKLEKIGSAAGIAQY